MRFGDIRKSTARIFDFSAGPMDAPFMEQMSSLPNSSSSSRENKQRTGLSDELVIESAAYSGLVFADGTEVTDQDPKLIGQNACIHAQLKQFVAGGAHPCVGAAASFRKEEYWLGVYDAFAKPEPSRMLAHDLFSYLNAQSTDPKMFASFIAVFKTPVELSEQEFEAGLWKQLTELDKISSVFFPWDSTVESDPESAKFSFSFAGKAFYVVGLHQNSSRDARSFKYPALVFNLHSQFEALRENGQYGRLRDTIRSRDEKLQGSINPMMRDFGSGSEARQYSGRAVDESWRCPFSAIHGNKGEPKQ